MSSRIASAIAKWITSRACSASSSAREPEPLADARERLHARPRVERQLAGQALAGGIRPSSTFASVTVGSVPPSP